MTTLLQKAKQARTDRKNQVITYAPNDEAIELVLAWIKNEVTVSEVAGAIGQPAGAQNYSFLARTLRAAYEKGLLKEVKP